MFSGGREKGCIGKEWVNIKFKEQEEKLTKTFNNITDDLKKEVTVQIRNEVSKRCKDIESESKMLKNQVAELTKPSIKNHSRDEELEQSGRCLCLLIDNIFAVSNELSDDIMNFAKPLFKEAKVSGPENVFD